MIDSIIVPPVAHLTVGSIVLLANFIFLLVVGRLAWQRRGPSPISKITFIFFQASLMIQALVGIKLLDQGLGVLQLYIHYLGGLAPLAFCLLYYWLPATTEIKSTRRLAGVAATSFLFVLLTFAVGSMATIGIDSTNGEPSIEVAQDGEYLGDPVRGKALYAAYGAGAHGINGEGVSGLGAALNTSEFIANQTDAELLEFLKVGRSPDDPENASGVMMPPNGSIADATDEDLLDVIAYLRVLQEQ